MGTIIGKAAAARMLAAQDKIMIITHVSPDGDTLGSGFALYHALSVLGKRVCVVNLMGQLNMDFSVDSPFRAMDALLKQQDADVYVVDFHAEATSEKGAMAWHLDGKVQALWGTHTHVPTADGKVLPRGLGFITDAGMVGPVNSVLGMKPGQAVNRFLGGLPQRFEAAEGPCQLNAVLFTIDTVARRCLSVQRVDLWE